MYASQKIDKSFKEKISRFFSEIFPRLPDDALINPKNSFHSPKKQLAGASLVINILSLALPILTLQVYDRLLVSQNTGTLHVLALGVLVAIALDAVLRLCRSYITSWTGTAYDHVVSCNAMRHTMHTDLVSLQKEGIGAHLQKINSIAKLREFVSGSALITLIDLPFVLVFLSLIAWLAGWLVLVPIVLLAVFVGFAFWIGVNLKKTLETRSQKDMERVDFIIESIEGIHSLKSMGLEPFFQRRYEAVQKKTSEANLDLGRLNAQAVMVGTLFSQIMIVSIIAIGAPMALSGWITMGTLIACVMLSARVTQPVQKALGLWTRYQDYRLAHEEVDKIFSMDVLDRLPADQLSDNSGLIEIKDLMFSYNPNKEVLFTSIDLDLKRGDAILISGPRGCGKTTLLKLIAGLYKPTQGEVYIDDIPATKYPARELVRHIGFLPMEGMIFRGTIWDNLSNFGEYSSDQVYEMVKLLDLETSIKSLPAGFDTRLEGGHSDPLPPGLRQRLAIARVLAPKPRVILFDNADRALDKEGYNTVYRLLARLKKKVTLILVSDDHNIARLADEEYLVDDGHLVKSSTSGMNGHDISAYQELRL